jgi:hypothetical protein
VKNKNGSVMLPGTLQFEFTVIMLQETRCKQFEAERGEVDGNTV